MVEKSNGSIGLCFVLSEALSLRDVVGEEHALESDDDESDEDEDDDVDGDLSFLFLFFFFELYFLLFLSILCLAFLDSSFLFAM